MQRQRADKSLRTSRVQVLHSISPVMPPLLSPCLHAPCSRDTTSTAEPQQPRIAGYAVLFSSTKPPLGVDRVNGAHAAQGCRTIALAIHGGGDIPPPLENGVMPRAETVMSSPQTGVEDDVRGSRVPLSRGRSGITRWSLRALSNGGSLLRRLRGGGTGEGLGAAGVAVAMDATGRGAVQLAAPRNGERRNSHAESRTDGNRCFYSEEAGSVPECCAGFRWHNTGRSDLVAAAVGGRTAVLPPLSFWFASNISRWSPHAAIS
ncbi:unnamed protein product [Pleuronectes platessa]|uniref:Uncharacterized protein n=1 Tax=Pleuronectes platessa TaxID=8262 RepID=A0A9N7VD17_PLEPL|nr:unnamed protein product [Pleuronectes platessa]